MADNDKRGADRMSAALRLKLRYTDVESFIDRYAANVSKGGIFIASRAPKPVGSALRFEFQLADGSPVVRGEGKVVWVKEFDPTQPHKPHGMGVKFTRLDSHSKAILDRMLAIKKQARVEGSGMSALPGETSGMIPLPAQASGSQQIIEGSGPRSLPAEGSGPRPAPAEGSGPRPAPAEGSGPRPAPAEGSGPRPAPAEGSGPRSLPAEGSGPRPAPAEGSGPRPAPAEGSGLRPAPAEDSGAHAGASTRPVSRIDPGATAAITLTLQPALEKLEALVQEMCFTDEALITAIAQAQEIVAGANGDVESLLRELGGESGAAATLAPTVGGAEGEPAVLGVGSPSGDDVSGPTGDPAGDLRRGHRGNVVKKVFGE
jgi:uncharacterized protein (TIGR02266 family)